jgi:hypothetical protein
MRRGGIWVDAIREGKIFLLFCCCMWVWVLNGDEEGACMYACDMCDVCDMVWGV